METSAWRAQEQQSMADNNSNNNQSSKSPRPGPGPRPGGRHGMSFEKPKEAKKSLMRLLNYLSPYKVTLILVMVLVIIYTLAGLAGPYLTGVAIDQYIIRKDLPGLGRISLLMLGTFIVYSILQALTGWVMANVSQPALKQLRTDLFGHLQKLSLGFYDRNKAGDLMSRLTNDINAINQAVSQNVTSLIANVLALVGILAAMFALNIWLSLATILIVPLMAWFTAFVAKYTKQGFQRLQKELGKLNSTIEENVSGQKVVKAFRRNATAIETFRKDNQSTYEAGIYANTYAFLLMPLTNQLGNLFIIILAGLGGYLALRGLVTVGLIAAFIGYSRQFLQPVRQLSEVYNSLQSALAGAERVFEIIDTEPELQDEKDAEPLKDVQGRVVFDNVRFSYLPENEVIKGMSLEARPGHTLALVGPTGAGKTTMINLLSRFYDVNSGRILVDGKDIRKVQTKDLRRALGIVLQDTFLFADTVIENIRYGRLDASDEECIQAAKMADADHFIRQLPDGYQTVLSERGSNLSQGQRQMLAISRAILADPAILILDEATSSVDTRTEARIQNALLRLMEGRTSFVIAHRLSTIRGANHVLVINDGQIVEEGNHQQLMDKGGVYYKLYQAQFKGQAI
ncbi:MAG TPA: ABC transporter ATP-binding protein [Pelolinea sp.]|nr:ABC transporter ATP-binding protein [Pelolinea sp.]